nr:lysylphosphatidylglycerol synthase transmembrane domain-containing protein [Membranihabitans marinus]
MVKIIFSVLLVFFIFKKIDLVAIKNVLLEVRPLYLGLAILFFILSKIIAAIRLHHYFQDISIPISNLANMKLYILGMFYNLFLPSGIGGDAYKGYILKNTYDISTKKIASVLFLDRLNGMAALAILALAVASCIDLPIPSWMKILIPIGIPLALFIFYVMHKKLFPYLNGILWKTIFLSFMVQLAQLASLCFILISLSVNKGYLIYLLIFLISSIVSVLPITIGGIGAREVTFFYGAQWLQIEEHLAISVSMVFFLITALVSFIGVYYHFKKIDIKS